VLVAAPSNDTSKLSPRCFDWQPFLLVAAPSIDTPKLETLLKE